MPTLRQRVGSHKAESQVLRLVKCNNMRFLLLVFLTASLSLAADDLDRLRDHQDRAGLDARATAMQAAAEKTPA